MKIIRATLHKLNNILHNRRGWVLVFYDTLLLCLADFMMLGLSPSSTETLSFPAMVQHFVLAVLCINLFRGIFKIYGQVWRYGGSKAFIMLMISDTCAGVVYYVFQLALPIQSIEFVRVFCISAMNLLFCLGMRLFYQYLYETAKQSTSLHGPIWKLFSFISGSSIAQANLHAHKENAKIKVAIIGAGNVGVLLAEELLLNARSAYTPCCFVEIDKFKIGRSIMGIPVLSNEEATTERLLSLGVQEIVLALPQIDTARKKALYEQYKDTGCKIKTYDYPLMQTAENGKRHLREFAVEELLFRHPVTLSDEKTVSYYRDKTVMITGGGGSIGSELCRQIATMQPRRIVILDVYENGAYEVQQELKIAYGNRVDVCVEIVSVCDRAGLEKVFLAHRPDVILHAAAHKHVPLMEHNCCEAVKNNVFGTLNTVELAIKHGVGRFIMVSTDKAVNPTNVMGATKRMCEMIVQSYSSRGTSTVFSATRFGNVLGSAGSVIPLFKKQIANGGPVTLTDKRIIRYFMTIPEASQLVLESGAMAENGELFVLDMGNPVKILELAENMIRLSGYEPYEDINIVEMGLRPGEKLYEELMIHTDRLTKTENSLIFIETDPPIERDELDCKLDVLRQALQTEDDQAVREALRSVVPTFRTPEEINATASASAEMQMATK